MRVIILANHLEATDGWSRYACDLAKNLKAAGHEILCLANKKSAADIDQRVVFGSPLGYLANPWRSFKTGKKIQSIFFEFQPDIIHVVTEPYASCLLFCHYPKAKIIMTIHGTYAYPPALLSHPLKHFLARLLTTNVYKKITTVIAVSSFTKNHLLKKINSSKLRAKIKVITNGIDLVSFPILNTAPARDNKIKKIMFVGGIKSGKGILEALAGLLYYKNNFSEEFQFIIVGQAEPETPYFGALQKFINENNLTNQVIFRGRISHEELLAAYKEADLFLMPSLCVDDKWLEGFGLVYLEAASHGVPCLGSKESGAIDAIIDGETGYLVDARDPVDIAKHIDLVLNKKTINPAECLAWAVQNDIRTKVKEIIEVYQKITN